MASAQEWGIEHYARLDRLTVALPDPRAFAALRTGKGEINAHFSRPPFADYELAEDAIHRVMDSFDVRGPHTDDVLIARIQFYEANPKLCAAVFAAVQEADALIRNNRGAAAEIYAAMAPDQEVSVEDLSDMFGDPDAAYTPAPSGVARLSDFMFEIKRIGHRPKSWKELFFRDVLGLPGS
jgi:sulfonate transport system substrate-binding protein